MQKKYWRIRYGFNVTDQTTVEGHEVEKAIFAQMKKLPIQLGDKFISGANIIAIEPNYHKYTGWYEYYQPNSGEDWKQIQRDAPDFTGVLEYHKQRVMNLINTGRTRLIGSGIEIKEVAPIGAEEKLNNGVFQEERKALVDKFKM